MSVKHVKTSRLLAIHYLCNPFKNTCASYSEADLKRNPFLLENSINNNNKDSMTYTVRRTVSNKQAHLAVFEIGFFAYISGTI